MVEMLSRVAPYPGIAVTSNLTPKPTQGSSAFVFYYNVEKCCTAQGANRTPPRANTQGGNTFCISNYFDTDPLQQKNPPLVVSNIKQ